MALGRGGLIASSGLGVVARNAVTVLVEIAEKELGVEIVLGSAAAEPGKSRFVARDGWVSVEKELGELILGRGIAGLSAGFQFGDGGGGGLLGSGGEWSNKAENE